jgi:hypothetical protein
LIHIFHNKMCHISTVMLQHTVVLILYRNYRKSSEAHCDQHNQKVATQRDIQCVFQLLHEPVDERDRYSILKILNLFNVTAYYT